MKGADMKRTIMWIKLLTLILLLSVAFLFPLEYLFGPEPQGLLFILAIVVMLCWGIVIIKVGNAIARWIGLDPPLKKGEHWWYGRQG